MNKTKVIIINGYPRSGKDTFAEYICCLADKKYDVETLKYSTVDTIKEIAHDFLDWNGEKTAYWRDKLSKMKDFFELEFKLSESEIIKIINSSKEDVGSNGFLFTVMIREPKQIEQTVGLINQLYSDVDCFTVFIDRNLADKSHDNHADANVSDYNYDFVIYNNEGLDEFKKESKKFLKKIMGDKQ